MVTLVTKACPMCGRTEFLKVTDEEWEKYNSPNRPPIQECFPNMSADDREMLVSGTCPKCWNLMFGEEDE